MAQGTKTKSRSSARTAAGNGRKAKSAAQHAPRGASAPVGRAANIVAAQQAAATGTKAAGRAVAAAASEAKAPLIIGGAAVTGVVGGLMATRHRRRPKRSPLGGLLRRDGSLDLESVASAARRLGSLSESVAEMAATAQSSRRR